MFQYVFFYFIYFIEFHHYNVKFINKKKIKYQKNKNNNYLVQELKSSKKV